jgi:uncharacterized membrane protein YeaQ/YmgE (transglycosylase-associated protein family)
VAFSGRFAAATPIIGQCSPFGVIRPVGTLRCCRVDAILCPRVVPGRRIMGWIVALIVGGFAGFLASRLMNRDASMGIFMNIVVGCVGSVIGNAILNQVGIAGSVQHFSITGLIVAIVGASVLLGIVNVVQRGKLR